MSLLCILASILSPVLIMSSSGVLCAMTISAPVLSSDILLHASVRSLTSSLEDTVLLPLLPRMRLRNFCPRALLIYLFPSLMRNLRISGWNMTMSARTPTSSIMSMIAVMSLMLNAPVSTLIRYSDTMAMKMLIAEVPRIHLNMKNMIRPSRIMSRMSARDSSRKPRKASGVIPLYISAQR